VATVLDVSQLPQRQQHPRQHTLDAQHAHIPFAHTHTACCVCRLAGSGLDLAALCLVPGKTCWLVYVDALVLNDGGNVLDALSIAARAALALTRVYKVRATAGGRDWQRDSGRGNGSSSSSSTVVLTCICIRQWQPHSMCPHTFLNMLSLCPSQPAASHPCPLLPLASPLMSR
jgi:hypothetical protein